MSVTYVTKHAKVHELEEIDAIKPLSIEVTERDIKLAKAGNSKECALARACKRALPNVKNAYFLRSTAWLEFEDKMVRYRLPQSVQKEIVSFDRSKMMSTGEYTLATVNPVVLRKPRVRKREKISAKKIVQRSKQAAKRHVFENVRTKFEPKEDAS